MSSSSSSGTSTGSSTSSDSGSGTSDSYSPSSGKSGAVYNGKTAGSDTAGSYANKAPSAAYPESKEYGVPVAYGTDGASEKSYGRSLDSLNSPVALNGGMKYEPPGVAKVKGAYQKQNLTFSELMKQMGEGKLDNGEIAAKCRCGMPIPQALGACGNCSNSLVACCDVCF